MVVAVIKYFTIILNCMYIYVKALNIQDIPKLKITSAIIFSCAMAVVMYILRPYMPIIRLIIMIASAIIFVNLTTSVQKKIMITTVLISIGASYSFSLLASIISTFIIHMLSDKSNLTLISILTALASFMFTYSLFRMKRLRKGFIFLRNKESWNISLIISGAVIVAISLVGIKAIPDIVAFSLFFIAVTCSFIMLYWWRYSITKLYHQKLNENTIQEYKNIIANKDEQLRKICESNDYMSKIIHRDNKLIPSMYYAVRDFIEVSSKSADTETQAKGVRILKELEDIMKERVEITLKSQRDYKTLPSTGVELIDNTLNYMLLKASENEIVFDFAMTVSVKQMIEDVIPKQSLNTLIAELVENAIISTDCSPSKKVLVTIGVVDGCYEINVNDSGLLFEEEVLDNLGIKKITTHGDTGGSGIGYISIFEILSKNNASLTITEHTSNTSVFSKSVKIRFDGKLE